MESTTQLGTSSPVRLGRLPLSWLLFALVGIAPALVTLVLITVHMQAMPGDFIPYLNDEVANWHQTLTFKEVGFLGGYYSVNERPPAAEFTHFYTYGPWHSMLFGTLARLTGWSYTLPLLFNSLTLLVAVLVFCAIVRPNLRQLGLIALLLLTFWPMLVYFLSYMQESFHQAIGIVSAGAFYYVVKRKGRLTRLAQATCITWLLYASITRTSWSVLFVPYFILTSRQTRPAVFLALLKSLLVIGLVLIVGILTGAPGNNSVFNIIGSFTISASTGVWLFVNYFGLNLFKYLNPLKQPLDVVQTVQVTGLIIGSLVMFFWLRRSSRNTKRSTVVLETQFHLLNLILIVFASMGFYIIGTGGDYRVIASHLLLSLLLLIAFKRYKPVLVVIAFNALCIPLFMQYYTSHADLRVHPDREAILAFAEGIQPHVHYNAALADKPWCNTLLFDVRFYDRLLTTVPGGVGLSFFFTADTAPQLLKSLYILLPDDAYATLMARPKPPRLELLAEMPNGTSIYRNLDADCGGSR